MQMVGECGPLLLLAHGLGGRPSDWQPLVTALQESFRVITFAQAGSLDADPALFEPERHRSLLGFADDLGALCAELGLRQICYVGHSLAAGFGALVMGQAQTAPQAQEFVQVLRQLDPQVTATCLEAAFRSDFRGLMGRLALPTLVLQSVRDPAVPLAAAEWLAAAIPAARLQVLPSEGHFPHVVDPALVLAAIRPFLQEALP